MLFAGRSVDNAWELALARLVLIELGETTLEDQVQGGEIVKVLGYTKPRRMRSFSGMKPGDLSFANVVLKQVPYCRRPSLDVRTRSEFETHRFPK